MKRAFLAIVFAAMFGLLLGQPSQANAETNGIYIAPKFLMSFGSAAMGGNDLVDRLGSNHYSSLTLGGALAVGYDFYPQMNIPLRAEVEYAMRGWGGNSYYNDYSVFYEGTDVNVAGADTSVKFTYSTLMANFYYDFHNSSNFTPYVGAGIGLAFIYGDFNVDWFEAGSSSSYSGNIASFGKSQTNLAWQVGAGVAYSFTENVAIDLAYRYLNMGYIEACTTAYAGYQYKHGSVGAYLEAHELMLGLRFTF